MAVAVASKPVGGYRCGVIVNARQGEVLEGSDAVTGVWLHVSGPQAASRSTTRRNGCHRLGR